MTKDSTPRRHHYLPRFYLQGFSDRGIGGKRGRVWATDFLDKKCFNTSPENLANIHDYYTVFDDAGQPDFSVEEKTLQAIESKAAPVIRQIDASSQIPTGQDWKDFCLFVASLQVRVPTFRQINHEINQHMFDVMAAGLFSSVDEFNAGKASYEADSGQTFDLTYEEAKKMFERDSEVGVPQMDNIRSMLHIMPQIADIATTMTPHLLVAQGRGCFVTGDNPIHFYDTNDERRESGLESVAWASPDVAVSVPLTKTCCLVLDWGQRSTVQAAEGLSVANCNTLRIQKCKQYLFSPTKDYPFLIRKTDVLWGADEAIRVCADKQDAYGVAIVGGPIDRRPPKQIRR